MYLLLTETANMGEAINTLIHGVSSLGFPVVMCILMMKYMKEKDENNRIEITELRKTIENNTLVVNTLLQRIGILDRLMERLGVIDEKDEVKNK